MEREGEGGVRGLESVRHGRECERDGERRGGKGKRSRECEREI